MKRICRALLIGFSLTALAEQPAAVSKQDGVMLAAVSRDDGLLSGGLGEGTRSGPGKIFVEPMARLSAAGDWSPVPCRPGEGTGCEAFAREYLSKPHRYTVVSSDGRGAVVRAAATKLDECYGYRGTATYSGMSIFGAAVAADADDFFSSSSSLRRLSDQEGAPIRKALAALVPKRLDSVAYLTLYSEEMEGRNFIVVQRAWSKGDSLKFIFAIGVMEQGRFRLSVWKSNIEDEAEQVVGSIRLKNGREFLVTTVSDPESQSFRVYGIENGNLVMVFQGGGSSC